MNAREIIARHLCTMAAQGWSGISEFERAAYRTTADGMVEAVTSAGFRILGPDEIDGPTVEKFKAEGQRLRPHYKTGSMLDIGRRQMLGHFDAFADRALKEKRT